MAPGRFSLQSGPSEGVGTLLHDGRPVGELAGVTIAAHFAIDGVGWLIVTDCDCPFEETIFLHLLGPDFTRLETLTMGEAYCPGIVTDIERTGPFSFGFCFPHDGYRHVLSISPTSRCRRLRVASTEIATGRKLGLARSYDQTRGWLADSRMRLAVGACILVFAAIALCLARASRWP
jgi:hypothetical protein